jgi:hypothetical protein
LIEKKPVKYLVKQSTLFDIKQRTILAIIIKSRQRHDVMDINPSVNKFREIRNYMEIRLMMPSLCMKIVLIENSDNYQAKKEGSRGFYRKKQMKNYSEQEYHQRSLIESRLGSLKRKYERRVFVKLFEMSNQKYIVRQYSIQDKTIGDFQQSLINRKIFK